ncbi:MAG: hypothetical protein K6F99_07380, partial [Lachnospiraceae bacterium]|nr:hypothetical protein [Lachnospiraceae bacterium]
MPNTKDKLKELEAQANKSDTMAGQPDEAGEKIPDGIGSNSMQILNDIYGMCADDGSAYLGNYINDLSNETKKVLKDFSEKFKNLLVQGKSDTANLKNELTNLKDVFLQEKNKLKNRSNPLAEAHIDLALLLMSCLDNDISLNDLNSARNEMGSTLHRPLFLDMSPSDFWLNKRDHAYQDTTKLMQDYGILNTANAYIRYGEKYIAKEKARRVLNAAKKTNDADVISAAEQQYEKAKNEFEEAYKNGAVAFRDVFSRFSKPENQPEEYRTTNLFHNLVGNGRNAHNVEAYLGIRDALKESGLSGDALIRETEKITKDFKYITEATTQMNIAYSYDITGNSTLMAYYQIKDLKMKLHPDHLKDTLQTLRDNNISYDEFIRYAKNTIRMGANTSLENLDNELKNKKLLNYSRERNKSCRDVLQQLSNNNQGFKVDPKNNDYFLTQRSYLNNQCKKENADRLKQFDKTFLKNLTEQQKELSKSTFYKFFIPNSQEYKLLKGSVDKLHNLVSELNKNTNMNDNQKSKYVTDINRCIREIKDYSFAYFEKYPKAKTDPKSFNAAEQARFRAANALTRMMEPLINENLKTLG